MYVCNYHQILFLNRIGKFGCYLDFVVVKDKFVNKLHDFLLFFRFSRCPPEQTLCGVHPVRLQVDEQPADEGIPPQMRHQIVGLLLSKASGDSGKELEHIIACTLL